MNAGSLCRKLEDARRTRAHYCYAFTYPLRWRWGRTRRTALSSLDEEAPGHARLLKENGEIMTVADWRWRSSGRRGSQLGCQDFSAVRAHQGKRSLCVYLSFGSRGDYGYFNGAPIPKNAVITRVSILGSPVCRSTLTRRVV